MLERGERERREKEHVEKTREKVGKQVTHMYSKYSFFSPTDNKYFISM